MMLFLRLSSYIAQELIKLSQLNLIAFSITLGKFEGLMAII